MPGTVWRMESERNIYLTFDDGPTPEITEWILDELDKYDAKATFFCLGKNAEQYPELFAKIVKAGHRIGNHSYSHIKGWGTPTEQYIEDVDFANQWLRTDLFRPPYGRISTNQAKVLSERYHLVMWDIISRDYNRSLSPRKCLRNVSRHIEPGCIIVFHDSVKAWKNMRYALTRTLEIARRKGYVCAPIEMPDRREGGEQ